MLWCTSVTLPAPGSTQCTASDAYCLELRTAGPAGRHTRHCRQEPLPLLCLRYVRCGPRRADPAVRAALYAVLWQAIDYFEAKREASAASGSAAASSDDRGLLAGWGLDEWDWGRSLAGDSRKGKDLENG